MFTLPWLAPCQWEVQSLPQLAFSSPHLTVVDDQLSAVMMAHLTHDH